MRSLFGQHDGFPVYWDRGYDGMAYSRGILARRIVVGAAFMAMGGRRQKMAVLLHEEGHLRRWHALKRLLGPFLWNLPHQRELDEEFEADSWVIDCGYGYDLADVLKAMPNPTALRMARIERLMRVEGIYPT